MRILVLTKYGFEAASTRQRFVQYQPALTEAGFELAYAPLFDDVHVRRIVRGRRADWAQTVLAYARRLTRVRDGRDYHLIWVHCELFPYLPGILERLISLTNVPLVLDYDDAIFHNYDLHRNALVRRLLGRKMRPLISRAAAVVAGNDYLASYARQWNDCVTIVPTVVDTKAYVPAKRESERQITIGWIGSPSTWTAYVRPYLSLLRKTCSETGARFLVVGAGDLAARDRFEGMEQRAWSEAREIADVQEMDIGIMPLPDDAWARGKCGYKLIQYMACGLPVVASPVGVNCDIVSDGDNGFLVNSPEAWSEALVGLLRDPFLRAALGDAGRVRAVRDYSLASQAPRLVDLFNSLDPGRGKAARRDIESGASACFDP